MPESVDLWWERRRRSKGRDVPYPVGAFRSDWERFPVLVRQFHPDLNSGIALTQVPPVADVYLLWQCDVGHLFVATPQEQRARPGQSRRRSTWCPECAAGATAHPIRQPRRRRPLQAATGLPGEAFVSAKAPRPASAAEPRLRQLLEQRLDVDFGCNAVRVRQPFFDRLEVWPDIVIPELRVAIEYDTVGRHGLEHVGPREKADRQKDRALRAVQWEVIRIRCGKLQPLGPHDIHAGDVNPKLIGRVRDALAEIRGELIVAAYEREPRLPFT